MNDDADLLRLFVHEGSQPALAELAQRYAGLVYASAARRLGRDAHLAGDVAQQVFLALARRPPRLECGESLAPWLYAAARHRAIDQVRAEQRRRKREEAALSGPLSPGPGREPDWDEVRPELEAALDELPAPDRDAVVLRYFADRSLLDVGRGLRVSEEAARKRVDRALERLRRALERRGVASTAAALGGILARPGLLAGAPPNIATACVQAAAGSQAAVGAAGLVSFMSTGKILTCLGALAVLLATGAAVRESAAAARAEAAVQQEQQSLDAALIQLRVAERQAVTVPRRAPGAAGTADALPGAPGGATEHDGPTHPPAGAPFRFDRAAARANARALLAGDPDLARALEAMQRTAAIADFREFLDGRRLTPEQEELFGKIMADASTGSVSISRLGADGPVSYDFGQDAPALARSARDAQLQQLLGDSGWQAFQDYSNRRTAWDASGLVAQDAFAAEEPLTADQRGKLAETMARYGSRSQGKLTVDWSGLAAAAAGFLSPVQQQALADASSQVQFNQIWSGGSGRVERRIVK